MKVLPTLTTSGFIYDKQIIMEKLYAYYTASDAKQSLIYKDHVYSIKKDIEENTQDIVAMFNTIKRSLIDLYSEYFHDIEVDIDTDVKTLNTSETKHSAVIKIKIKAKDDEGNEYSLDTNYNLTDETLGTYTLSLYDYYRNLPID